MSAAGDKEVRTPDFELICTGLRLAAEFELPLRVNGRDVRVPSGLVPPFEGAEDEAPDVEYIEPGVLETARRIAYLVRLAGDEIEATGLELGLWQPPERPRATITQPAPVEASVLQPEPATAEVARDTWHIGSPPLFEVRSTGDASWICVRLPNELVAWHPTQFAALAWAKQAANDAWRPGASAAQTAGR
jgi:hypothetical protein